MEPLPVVGDKRAGNEMRQMSCANKWEDSATGNANLGEEDKSVNYRLPVEVLAVARFTFESVSQRVCCRSNHNGQSIQPCSC